MIDRHFFNSSTINNSVVSIRSVCIPLKNELLFLSEITDLFDVVS